MGALSSPAEFLAAMEEEEREAYLCQLTLEARAQLRWEWAFWARPNQLAPEGDWRTWLALAGRGFGKALAIDTPIPTPHGWTDMGDLRIGDEIFAADGSITQVIAATPIQFNRQCYRVRFSDGAEIVADADHRWTARSRADRRANRPYRTVTTRDMLECLGVAKERNWQMPAARPLRLPPAELPIDPYLLGYWLGDGTSQNSSITIGIADQDEVLPLIGHSYAVRGKDALRCMPETIVGERDVLGRACANGSIQSSLRALGVLRNKHIPTIYLRASESQREDLLAGLIDSDGWVNQASGLVEITSTKRPLAFGVLELARTLGHRARLYEERATIKGRDVGAKYRISWVARGGGGKLKRKGIPDRSGLGQPNRLITRYVDSIEPVESVPVRCIAVSNDDHLYLAGRDFLVTHNTEAGAQWIRQRVEAGARHIALIAETQKDLEEVMVARIIKISPPEMMPTVRYKPVRVTWPNGAQALGYNGTEPDQLRGPEFDTAWCDELAKYRYARETWDMLSFTMRSGNDPRVFVTTTPRPIPVLREIIADPTTVVTRGSTMENASNLPTKFLADIRRKYEGTRLGRQELNAEMLDDVPGALWTRDVLDQHRRETPPQLARVVVAVDPSGTKGEDSGDDIGIVAAGMGVDGRAYVLEDATCQLSPDAWGRRAIEVYHRHGADRIVAERNFGGAMVEFVIRSADKTVPFKEVTASRGKFVRAEPVAALYEQGRVSHIGSLPDLEDQMCCISPSGFIGEGSPDRADALVWALTELMLGESMVLPVEQGALTIEPFPIPAHFAKGYGLEIGPERTSAIFGAWDRDNDVLYLFAEHSMANMPPAAHAGAIKARGDWLIGAFNPQAPGRTSKDGEQLRQNYRGHGLHVVASENSIEAGVEALMSRLSTGRLKVFSGACQTWLAEHARYRRTENGAATGEDEPLLAATRSLVLSMRNTMRTKPVKLPAPGDSFMVADSMAGY